MQRNVTQHKVAQNDAQLTTNMRRMWSDDDDDDDDDDDEKLNVNIGRQKPRRSITPLHNDDTAGVYLYANIVSINYYNLCRSQVISSRVKARGQRASRHTELARWFAPVVDHLLHSHCLTCLQHFFCLDLRKKKIMYINTAIKVKVKVWTLAIAPLTWVRLVTSSALQSRKWQLIGMSQWCRSALCGHPLPALTDNLTHGASSRHTIAPISHIRPSPRSRSYYSSTHFPSRWG